MSQQSEDLLSEEEKEEFCEALAQAKSFSDTLSLSKAAIEDMLCSGFSEDFSPEAIKYAIENIEADFEYNAFKTALSYKKMGMTTQEIFKQLCSPAGERFTRDEAQFAIEQLNKTAR